VTVLTGEHVLLRPVRPADGGPLRAIREEPGVARWWGPVTDDRWPLADDETTRRWAIEHEGTIVGLIQDWAEQDADLRHAGIDLFLSARVRGRGLGPDAIRALVRHCASEGHHRITIDPQAANAAAVRAYEKVGFRPVGIMRRHARDPRTGAWVDSLLMDLLVEELR
jgi:aminoglycoside 6'-N-acetyltransferase